MKNRYLPILFLPACFTGCSISSESLGGGYELSTMRYASWEPGGVSRSLYFRQPHGWQNQVWKNLALTDEVLVEGSTALFAAPTRPEYKLIAVKNGAPLLEVGKPILAFEAQRKGL